MKLLDIYNPFNSPVYHAESAGSTMDISRDLARRREPHGTVITVDFQAGGRGRLGGRQWTTERGESLPFTILLKYPSIEAIPRALTLRAGLAAVLAIEDFAPALCGRVMIKWPNDIMILDAAPAGTPGAKAKKVVGILTEAENGNVHIGMGVNVGDKQFPGALAEKATSIDIALGRSDSGERRFSLLEKILRFLYTEIEPDVKAAPAGTVNSNTVSENKMCENWKSRIERRLYKMGEPVCFAEGAADSGKTVEGILSGIGPSGELLILTKERLEEKAVERSFLTGELLAVYGNQQPCGKPST